MILRQAATAELLSRNPVFDAFRGVCALLVVAGHGTIVSGRPAELHHGAVIVDAFFLISGFLLCQQYDRAFAKGARSADLLIKRLVRIYPIYLAALVCGFALLVFESRRHLDLAGLLAQASASLLMLPAPPLNGGSVLFPSNPPCWSLMWEVWLNVLFILGWRRLRGGVLLAVIAVAGAGVVIGAALRGSLDFGFDWGMLFGGGARAAFAFFFGVLLARIHARSTWRPSAPGVFVLIGFFALVFAPMPKQVGAAYELALLFMAVPILVWVSAGSSMPRLMVVGCVFVGDLYYGVYAWHVPVLKVVRHSLEALHLAPSMVWLWVAFPLVPLWAFLSNRVDGRIRQHLLRSWRDFRAGTSIAGAVGAG